jgi:hypothetical protein
VLHKTLGGAAPPVPYSGFAGGMGSLHQDPGPAGRRRYHTSVRSGVQEVDPLLLYGQLQESPPCAAWAPVEAHSLGRAEWAAEVGPSVAGVRAADERSGRHATWNDILEIRLRWFVLFFFLNWKEETYLEWNVAYHPIRCQWSKIREDRLPT